MPLPLASLHIRVFSPVSTKIALEKAVWIAYMEMYSSKLAKVEHMR